MTEFQINLFITRPTGAAILLSFKWLLQQAQTMEKYSYLTRFHSLLVDYKSVGNSEMRQLFWTHPLTLSIFILITSFSEFTSSVCVWTNNIPKGVSLPRKKEKNKTKSETLLDCNWLRHIQGELLFLQMNWKCR